MREQSRSGYEIWRWLGATHGGDGTELNEANLYPTLHRMEAQRLIQGEWDEGEKTRRLYRVASRAAVLAERQGWPVLSRPLSHDPIAGDEPVESRRRLASPATIPEFVDRFAASLPLSEPSRADARDEIRDHLEDSAAGLIHLGRSPEEAVGAAIRGLGMPEELAAAIAHEQQTRERLIHGMGSAAVSGLLGAAIGLAGGAVAALMAPVVARAAATLVAGSGYHLYMPETAEWYSQQAAAALSVAAFCGARRSLPVVAERSHRSIGAVRLLWALAGGVLLLAVALLVPEPLDPTAGIALLGIPVAFGLGTLRYQRPGDDLLSRAGMAQAALLLGAFLFLPGIRVWYWQPASPTADPTPSATSAARIQISGEGVIGVVDLDQENWTDARIELRPAARQGLEILPDDRAALPSFAVSPGGALTVSSLPNPPADWWVVLTATDRSGARRTLDVAVLTGPAHVELRTILGWILGPK